MEYICEANDTNSTHYTTHPGLSLPSIATRAPRSHIISKSPPVTSLNNQNKYIYYFLCLLLEITKIFFIQWQTFIMLKSAKVSNRRVHWNLKKISFIENLNILTNVSKTPIFEITRNLHFPFIPHLSKMYEKSQRNTPCHAREV